MRRVAPLVIALGCVPLVASAQRVPPQGPGSDLFFRNPERQRQILFIDSIDVGELAPGTSAVLQDSNGRTIQLAGVLPPTAVKDAPLRQVLRTLAAQAGVDLQFDPNVDMTTAVSFTVTRPTPIGAVLTQLLRATRLRVTIVQGKLVLESIRSTTQAK
jgi:hypothetical protein